MAAADKKRMRTATLSALGMLILFLIFGLQHDGHHQAASVAQNVGDQAPMTDLPLAGDSGARFKTAQWRGRPYIVNFFAGWCQECHVEHEELMTLQAARVPIIGIVFKDSSQKATAYLNQNGDPFAAVALDDDALARKAWHLTGVPETFVIDARGIMRWHYIGALTDQAVMQELMPVWESLKTVR